MKWRLGVHIVSMRNALLAFGAALACAALTALSPHPVHAAYSYITIGTGGVTGVYYPAGGAICRFVNRERKTNGIRCAVESTGGSGDNLRGLRAGDLELGIAQSDVHYAMVNGTEAFASDGPWNQLRSLFSLHQELFTVVARAGAGIKTFDDLKGRRVNVGNPGSGQRNTLESLMNVKGWTMADFSEVSELPSSMQSRALCSDQVDAIVFTAGHPNASILEAATTCDIVLVSVNGPSIDRLLAEAPYYHKGVIPAGTYPGVDADIATFGLSATVVTPANVSDPVIYEITKAVFENFNSLKELHRAFKNLNRADMLTKGLTAPLHPGAARYYREVGLLPQP